MDIITVCKGRSAHLLQSLPTWLETRTPLRVNVVDYGCPDKAQKSVLEFFGCGSRHSLNYISVSEVGSFFNLSHAKNIGYQQSVSDKLVFLHCDISLAPGALDDVNLLLEQASLVLPTSYDKHALSRLDIIGFVAVQRWLATKLRGFDEQLCVNPNGWGYETENFIQRALMLCRQKELEPQYLADDKILPADHADSERVRFYDIKDPMQSYYAHRDYSEWYLKAVGVEANKGHDFGQAIISSSIGNFWGSHLAD